ncbi:MFS transporter [Paenibacillus caui]|uniref:MFS transporter n=1 Tax=Paenibacillus caui TaxID=2873927 RepID=UPI001F008FB3|nr:MFS transporter [Paenibacillus caui]
MRLLIIFLSVTNAFIIIYGPQPILPLFMREFAISMSMASLSISLTIFGIVLSSIFLAIFSDKWDRKKVILVSNLLLIIPSLALFFTHSFGWLLVLRFFQGTLITGVTTILMRIYHRPLQLGIVFFRNNRYDDSGQSTDLFLHIGIDWAS